MSDKHLAACLIEIAKTLGWSIEHNGTSNCLVNMSHPSALWCAEWSKHTTLDGTIVYVPHWLPDVIKEEIEKLLYKEEQYEAFGRYHG